MSLLSLIVLAVIWLSIAAVFRAIGQRYPWQGLQGDRKRVQFIQGLEAVRHGVSLLYWLFSVVTLCALVGFFDGMKLSPVFVWVVVCAALAEGIVRVGMVQTYALQGLHWITRQYGKYLAFIYAGMKALDSLGRKIITEIPIFRDRRELAQLIAYHGHTFHVLSESDQSQLLALLSLEHQTVKGKMIEFADATVIRAEETLGPLVLTELYDSPYDQFIVYKKRHPKPVGVLDQRVAVSHASTNRKVADVMEERVVYLPHDATIAKAVQTFLETSSLISVIIDDEEEPVGVLYIQDVLGDLFSATKE